MTKYIRPLFDIQRVHVDGSRLHYEIFYRDGQSYRKLVDACFLTKRSAELFINDLLSEV